MGKGKIKIIEDGLIVDYISQDWQDKSKFYIYANESRPIAILEEEIDEKVFHQFTSTKLDSKDIVYFDKSSLTPRSRIKEYCTENNIILNKTNRIDNADTFVFNSEDVKLFKNDTFIEYYILPVEKAITMVKINGQMGNNVKYLYIKTYQPYLDKMMIDKIKHFPTIKAFELSSIKLDNSFRTLKVFLTKPEAKIVFDQTILNTINSQNIDLDMYLNLRSSFRATEGGNSTLGAGIIGNCNPEDNKIPLVLLIAENWNKIKSNKQSNFTFRALIEYYKNYPFYNGWKHVLNELLIHLKGKVISEDHHKILELFLIEQIKIELSTGYDNKIPLEIESIKFKLNYE